jgi:tetratricopeptide (TPR) repeat protein
MPKTFLKNKWFSISLIALVSIVVYYNSLRVPFIFDDNAKIVKNLDIRKLSNVKTKLIYPYDSKCYAPHRNDPSRPLTYFTFILNYHFGKLSPFGYHIFNVFLHICNSILIFFFARKIIFYAFKKNSILFPAFTSLLFTVHPINTSVVTYISGRSDLLAMFFYVLSLLFFIKTFEKNKRFYILSLMSFLLGIFSKQTAVTLPAAILIFDYIFLSNFKIKNIAKKKYYHLLFWVILCAYILFRYFYFGTIGDLEGGNAVWDRYPYIIIQPYVILRYLAFLFVPAGLCHYHYLYYPATLFEPKILVSLAVIAGIFISLYSMYIRKSINLKIALFSVLWFFITLAPVSSLFPTTTAMVENRLYLSGFGFYLLIVFVYFLIFCREISPCNNKPGRFLISLITIHILLLGISTIKRNKIYQNPVALWKEVISRYPGNMRAYHNLGNLYSERKEYRKAVLVYKEVLKMNPEYAEVRNSLANVYLDQRNYDMAIIEYKRTLDDDPDFAEAHINLGNSYSCKGEFNKAIREYNRALEIDPNQAGAHYNAGVTYSKQRKYNKAVNEYKKALKINPDHMHAQRNLENLLNSLTPLGY